MTLALRMIDTGVRDGRQQIAFDEALIELHKSGQAPDTLRFLRFPPTVLVGRHQVIGDVVDVPYCRANGIGLVRRITPGGAIYLDEGQVGWELVLSRRRLQRPALADYAQAVCEAVAHGLSRGLGIGARYAAPTDIMAGDAKLCGTGGYFDGETLVYQGTVLVDVDMAAIARCLKLPRPVPGAASPPRMTTLKAMLAGAEPTIDAVHRAIVAGLRDKLGAVIEVGAVTAEEEALAARLHDEEIGLDAFVFGTGDNQP